MLCGLIQLRHPEKEINFPLATLVGYSNAIYLRLCHPSINHSLRLAVKPSRRPSEGLYISLNKFCDYVNHIFEGCHISKASLVESYCTVDIFEEGAYIIEGISGDNNFTDGNKEYCNPTEDPGVEA